MPIPVYIAPCNNPNGADGVEYACIKAKTEEIYNTEQIVNDIVLQSTFSKADIVAVIHSITEYLKVGLLAGQNVYLGNNDFGFLYIGLKSSCFDQASIASDTFSPESHIAKEKSNVRFRPCRAMKTEALGNYTLRLL